MCGFVFQYDSVTSTDYALNRIKSALNEISHRGPDDLRAINVGAAYFAHARLSIIDVAASKQPMQSADSRYTLVFNGEIYNFQELRQRLEDHWRFQTSGDTEVLLAGLVLEGEGFIKHLEGMWAFAFWDSQDRQLLLSRDRMGKKPLYYRDDNGAFSCASELAALKTVTENDWCEDLDSAADYFRYGFCLPGFTMYERVFEVKPAHYLIWKEGGSITERPYWSLNSLLSRGTRFTDDDLRDALHHAVKKRLVADVEVGAFLSGGIDSSLVCSIAQKDLGHRLKTYTVGFSESSFDESNYAARMSEALGSEHYCEVLDSWDSERLEALLRNNVGQPYADASLLPTSMVCDRAARDVKVVLSGDGADELFGGYQRYQAHILFRWYSRLPKQMRSMASKALESLPSPMVHHSRSLLKKAQMFVESAERQSADPRYIAPSLFSAASLSMMSPVLSGRGHTVAGLEDESTLEGLQRMLFADCLVYLPQDILPKVDRASMAASLEVRSPFLDSKVIEIALSRPARQHLRVGSGKKWLRQAFADQLPEWVWERRKQGFGVPLNKWFCGDLGRRLESYLTNASIPLDVDLIKAMLAKHRTGQGDYGMALWAIYVYLSVGR